MSAVQPLNNTNEGQSYPLRAHNSPTHSQWWISSCDVHRIRWLRGIFPHRNEQILPHHRPLMYPWPSGASYRCLQHVFAPVNCQVILNLLWKKLPEKRDSPIRINCKNLQERNIFNLLMWINILAVLFPEFSVDISCTKCKALNWKSSLSWSGDPTKLEGQRVYHSHCQHPRTIFIVIRRQGNRKWEIVHSDCTWSKSQDDQENSIS